MWRLHSNINARLQTCTAGQTEVDQVRRSLKMKLYGVMLLQVMGIALCIPWDSSRVAVAAIASFICSFVIPCMLLMSYMKESAIFVRSHS